jgi:Bacterial-like globin
MVAMSSLFDWAGGEAAFTRLINAFYDRVEADELLSPVFPRHHRGNSAAERAPAEFVLVHDRLGVLLILVASSRLVDECEMHSGQLLREIDCYRRR